MRETGSLQSAGPEPGKPAPTASAIQPGSVSEILGTAAATCSLGQVVSAATVLKVAVLAALMAALHLWQIDVMVRTWLADSNWSHGFIIPLFSAYLLYSRREDLAEALYRTAHPQAFGDRSGGRGAGGVPVRAPVRRGAGWAWGRLMLASPRRDLAGVVGLVLMLLALLGEVGGVLVRNYWVVELFMVALLFALVLYLSGPKVIRVTWLPILFLVFALPVPKSLYERVALPLQHFSAKGATVALRVLGVQIESAASRLDVVSQTGTVHTLTVAEACSGMHLLMAFLALGVAMAYLDYKPIWQRVILVAAAIPIAILCNVIRVAITCWMYYIDQPDMGQGFMHYFAGMLMLVPAFLMLWLLALILKWLFVEEEAEAPRPRAEEAAS